MKPTTFSAKTTSTPAVPPVDRRTFGHEAEAVRAAEQPRRSNDDDYLRLHVACSQRGIRVEYSNGPRITEPTIKLVAGVVTYFVPKNWDLQDAQDRLPGLHDGFTARESVDRYIAANHPHVDAMLNDGAREHREQVGANECARPGCPCRNTDLAYADGEVDITVGGHRLKACDRSKVEAAVSRFEALRDGADPKLNEFIDMAVDMIRKSGDPQAFSEWLLDSIKARAKAGQRRGHTA
ncbi:hypothetical protein ACFVIL_29310 [Streptomyces sp. NPDC127159]|uniref:hypothetical protein n=1 Tax=unclassified Streptomyces TaxID=2593676 RepID=UPI003633F87C